MRGWSRRTLTLAAAALLLSSCATVIEGTPESVFADPFKVAGMEATDGPTGLRDDAAPATRDITGTDGGKFDRLAGHSVSDIEQFWQDVFGATLPGTFTPVDALVSWDSNEFGGIFCDYDTFGVINAGFCPLDNTIGWDRGRLLPDLSEAHGDMAVTMVLAHEYGHAVQLLALPHQRDAPTLVREQQADCFSGAYMRWVAEGDSPRFTLSTGDGLNALLVGMIAFRDPPPTELDLALGAGLLDEHGSAFERISAFQFGFTDGASVCLAIDADEITARRGDLPVSLQLGVSGDVAITEEMVRALVEALTIKFGPATPPTLSFTDTGACPDARPSPPASYCPATDTLTVDLPALAELGADPDLGEAASVAGDNSAFSVVMSRYMLALQRAHGGLKLDTAEAALRTACLTGVATTALSQEVTTHSGQTITLAAGDLDEAVAGLLSNGLAASDVNGDTVPAGFSRVDAFRMGVLGDTERCIQRFP